MGDIAPGRPSTVSSFGGPAQGRGPLRDLAPWVGGIAALAAVLVWAAGRYGYHRDELYFLACGRRLAWGYPDQPPLTPLLARASELLLEHSSVALRAPAVALCVGATLLAALIARDLGGGPFARGLAAFAVGTGTFVLLSGHLLATSTVDFAVWVTLTWIATRLLRTGDRRWWLAYGGVLGVGLLNKQLPVVLTGALVVGILLTPSARPLLRGPLPWAGAALAMACWAPVLGWQARHGWPQFTLAGQIHDEYGQLGKRLGFYLEQGALFSIGATVLWVIGLRTLFRDPVRARYRPLAWAWPVLMLFFTLTAGQVYYAVGIYPALIAAGAVAVEQRTRRVRRAMVLGVAASALLLVPVALPVLSPSTLDRTPWAALSEPQREMVGWPSLVDRVAVAYASFPAAQRARTVVVTSNYGEAGAVEEYGPSRGVPRPAYSGHNGFAAWGPPPQDDAPAVVVHQSDPPGSPPPGFTGCRSFGRIVTGVHNEESQGATVWACAGVAGGWRAAWPSLTHLSA
jgi:hypothetical protein